MRPLVDDTEAWFDEIEGADATPRELLSSYFDLVSRHRRLGALTREPAEITHADLLERSLRWIERAQELFAGPEADLGDRVRATMAIAGLARIATLFPHIPPDDLRPIAVEAALRTLGLGEPSTA